MFTENENLEALQNAVNALVEFKNNKTNASKALGLPRTTYNDMLERAERLQVQPTIFTDDAEAELVKREIKHKIERNELRRQVQVLATEKLSHEMVRQEIFQLSDYTQGALQIGDETLTPLEDDNAPEIPTIFLSDWHWGETVESEHVNGYNEYSPEIAKERFERTIDRAIKIIDQSNKNIPAVVVALGGDMVSGDIHDDLRITNGQTSIEAVLDFFDHLTVALSRLMVRFDKVFVVCTFGNHGRNTVKPLHKKAAATNYDWLISTMLEKFFKDNDDIEFVIPQAFDTNYKIFNTNYILTHGDRLGVRGGDGQIGMLGPIARGVKKIKAYYASLNNPIDYIIMGHFHTQLWLPDAIVNGTGKGFDEYALANRFAPALPTQSIWFTHPKYGVCDRTDIYADDLKDRGSDNWVSWRS